MMAFCGKGDDVADWRSRTESYFFLLVPQWASHITALGAVRSLCYISFKSTITPVVRSWDTVSLNPSGFDEIGNKMKSFASWCLPKKMSLVRYSDITMFSELYCYPCYGRFRGVQTLSPAHEVRTSTGRLSALGSHSETLEEQKFGKKQTTAGILIWSPTIILICRFAA